MSDLSLNTVDNSYMIDQRDNSELNSAISLAEDIITRNYLCRLENMSIAQIDPDIDAIDIESITKLFQIKRVVSDKHEDVLDKLVTVLNAAYSSEASVIALIKGNGFNQQVSYYLGIVNKSYNSQKRDTSTIGNTFEKVLKGNFSGAQINKVKKEEFFDIQDDFFRGSYISAISGISSIRHKDDHSMDKYVQGIEHLADAMSGLDYSILIIADPVISDEIERTKLGLENLYTQLSAFAKTELSFSQSGSLSVSDSHSTGIAETIGQSVSLTQNYTETNGWNKSETNSKSKTRGYNLEGALIGGAVGTAVNGVVGLTAGAVIGNMAAGLLGTKTAGLSIGEGTSGSSAISKGKTESRNDTLTHNTGDAHSEGETYTNGTSLQFSCENKVIEDLLETIGKNIERIDECSTYGAFNYAAYVISTEVDVTEAVSSSYNALMRGDSSSLQTSHINSWGKNAALPIMNYLKKFSHPVFLNDTDLNTRVTPASLINAYELAVGIGMPKKSLTGLPVYESVSFGRNVINSDTTSNQEADEKTIKIGTVYHLGRTEDRNDVLLSRESLSMHTFISGSTGSGKSNTVYEIIRQLHHDGIKFMVIEPTKGEYKNVFGGFQDVSVFGTNPKKTELLILNPFRFEDDIHVLEHVDRIIEIFNACWPMYAAMPAVLKKAVIESYKGCGWNLITSECDNYPARYPSFADLLICLDKVIEESAYDGEVKSNYKGSLETRVESLSNGLNGLIFSNNEVESSVLFDNNTIIDLSRISSLETKSLIMGFLIMRLNEYRVSQSSEANAQLKHVTVLEEAHNILKNTSSIPSAAEGNSTTSMSVEMLSNAIAEMRTYGEGFIIVDQSPSAVDISAIRNTNTKIIMRLPENEDRRSAGKSVGLKDEQIDEIAKLPKGVAVVYQNNWVEPVLALIDKYEGEDNHYRYIPNLSKVVVNAASEDMFVNELLKMLVKGRIAEPIEVDIDMLAQNIDLISIPESKRADYRKLIQEYQSYGELNIWKDERFGELSSYICDLIAPKSRLENVIYTSNDFSILDDALNRLILNVVADADGQMLLAIRQSILKKFSVDHPENIKVYAKWIEESSRVY